MTNLDRQDLMQLVGGGVEMFDAMKNNPHRQRGGGGQVRGLFPTRWSDVQRWRANSVEQRSRGGAG